jgi:hypothetical protein
MPRVMKLKQIVLGAVLVDFTALSAWAFYTADWSNFATTMAEPLMIQVATDLALMASIVCVWMWRDAKQRGINPLPHVLLTICTGSIGALAYLVRRAGSDAEGSVIPAKAGIQLGSPLSRG